MIGTRRRVMRLAWSALATGVVPRIGFASQQHDIVAVLADPHAAAAVGRAWLQGHVEPRPTLQALRTAVLDELLADAAMMPDQTELAARLRACISNDFAAARVVMVDGWMLSRIEAQACAIACLSDVGEI